MVTRRALLASSALVPLVPGVSVAAQQASPVAAPGGSVPMFRAGPSRTGVMPGPGPAGAPRLRWRFDAGEVLITSPAVADGAVFITSGAEGSASGHTLFAVDAVTGAERWRADVVAPQRLSGVAVVDGTVYAPGSNLFAFDAATGEAIWTFDTEGWVTASSPAVVDGAVYIGDDLGLLYAVDAVGGDRDLAGRAG